MSHVDPLKWFYKLTRIKRTILRQEFPPNVMMYFRCNVVVNYIFMKFFDALTLCCSNANLTHCLDSFPKSRSVVVARSTKLRKSEIFRVKNHPFAPPFCEQRSLRKGHGLNGEKFQRIPFLKPWKWQESALFLSFLCLCAFSSEKLFSSKIEIRTVMPCF